MNHYLFEIPITNYDETGVFHQSVYIHAETSPTKHQLLVVLETLHERDSKYVEYIGDFKECLDVINIIPEASFPRLHNSLVQTSAIVKHRRYGAQYLTIKRLLINEVE